MTLGLLAFAFGITEQFLPALVVGLILLALFFWIERRATAPLVAIEMLALPSVRWGNLAALTIFSMEAGLVFLTTLYLQNVLHFGPLTTGLIFGVPGLASVAAGVVAGRIIGRRGARIVLLAALLIQGGLTAPMILLGTEPIWLWLLIPALFGGFFGHITAVVAATVTATSEVPDAHKGLATGLVTTSQRVAVTVGIPVLGAVMAIRSRPPGRHPPCPRCGCPFDADGRGPDPRRSEPAATCGHACGVDPGMQLLPRSLHHGDVWTICEFSAGRGAGPRLWHSGAASESQAHLEHGAHHGRADRAFRCGQ